MTHHRDRFERVYALTEHVAPPHLIRESDEEEVNRFLIKKEIAFGGLSRLNRTSDSFRRGEPDRAAKQILGAMLADGDVLEYSLDPVGSAVAQPRLRTTEPPMLDRGTLILMGVIHTAACTQQP